MLTKIETFSFYEEKRADTIAKHGIDLLDTRQLFDGRPHYTYPSPRHGQERFTTIAELHGKLCAVAWMYQEGGGVHLITARRAQEREERQFDRLGLAREAEPSLTWWDRQAERSPPVEREEPEISRDDGLER